MFKRLFLALALLAAPLVAPVAAHAQQARVVATCGGLTYGTGQQMPLTQDATGTLCTASGPGGTSSTVTQGSTTSGQSGTLVQGAVTTASPTYTTAQTSPLSLDTAGNLRTGLYFAGTSASVGGTAANADAASGAITALNVGGFNLVWNGATWDRARGNTTGLAIIEGGLPASHWNYAAATGGIVNTTTAVTMKTAGGAGVRNCISNIQVNHAALGAATELAVRDGAAGTVVWRTQLQTTAVEAATYNLTPAICGTANTLMEVVTLTAVTGAVYVDAQGYVSP